MNNFSRETQFLLILNKFLIIFFNIKVLFNYFRL